MSKYKKKIKEFGVEDVINYCQARGKKNKGCNGCPFNRLCDENCSCNPRELAQYLDQEIEVEE